MVRWPGSNWDGWQDVAVLRALLDAGADPDDEVDDWLPVLHHATESGSAEVVAEIAGRVADIEVEDEGRTALWSAVYTGRPDVARALVAAGADPWRPMMAGWSPGRLALTGPTPELFGGGGELTPEEVAAVAESRRLVPVLARVGAVADGLGLACVAGVDVAEALRRIGATVIEDAAALVEGIREDPGVGGALAVVGVTDVPGGCVLAQPWGFAPQVDEVVRSLSVGTVCTGLYRNPKGGDHGIVGRDGEVVGSDSEPGGPPDEHAESAEVLASYLYRDSPVAQTCAGAGLRLVDARAVAGEPDLWIRLPGVV